MCGKTLWFLALLCWINYQVSSSLHCTTGLSSTWYMVYMLHRKSPFVCTIDSTGSLAYYVYNRSFSALPGRSTVDPARVLVLSAWGNCSYRYEYSYRYRVPWLVHAHAGMHCCALVLSAGITRTDTRTSTQVSALDFGEPG